MKGFTKSSKGSGRNGFRFPESAGFTNSTGKVQSVKGYNRTIPLKKADGGQVGHPEQRRNKADAPDTLAEQFGGRGPLTPGYAKGGDIKQDQALVNKAIKKHVAAPKPAGHGVTNGRGFNRSPLIGD